MDSPASDPWIGRLVDGRYEVVARLARGGMATVYRAVDRRLDRTVAVKIMHAHLAESPEFVARFRREARAAARLSHPGIVAVHDQGMAGETSYLVMEYVEGPNLRTTLRSRGSLPLGEALDLIDQVLDALAAAHRAGLVHRDIKPENVLITADGRPKVADFGLARAVSEATAATTGTVLGTVAYLAPEIVTSGAADARADVYAVGVLLYELLTGHQPFTGEVPIQVAFQHVNSTVPPPSAELAWLPAEVDELVAAFTARDVTERVPDAIAARELLRRCRAGLDGATLARRADVAPAPPPPPSVLEDSGSTAVTGLREGHGTVALPIGAISHEAPVPVARRRRRRGRTLGLSVLLAVVAVAVTGVLWWFQAGPGAYTVVPDVTGEGEAAAVAALEAADLGAAVSRENHDEVPEGAVIRTDPAASERVRRGTQVGVVVSDGVLMIDVPDVTGEEREAAERAITDAGLSVGDVEDQYSDSVPAGVVISSTPPGGAVVRHDTPVDLVVSAGREPAEVVNVTGLDRDDAVAALEEEGLIVEVDERYSDTVPENQVISQDPQPGEGAELFRGDTVRITVSLGPELFPVPDVIGSQVNEAQRTLADAGFEVEIEEVLGGFFGTVRAMDPQPGAMVPRGTVITLTVV